jgi:hypothetical protein
MRCRSCRWVIVMPLDGAPFGKVVNAVPIFSLVNIDAVHARAKGLSVVHKPIKDDTALPDNPAHAEVIGKKTQGIARYLAANATWIHLEPKP